MSDGTPCRTCKRSYGIRVGNPDRCGVCLTGLSMDGRPVVPFQGSDGRHWDPIVPDQECAQLSDGTWIILWDDAMCAALSTTRDRVIARAEADRAAGIW